MGKPNFSGGLRYKRWPGSYGGKPSLAVDNTLDRQFDVAVVSRIFRKFIMAVVRSVRLPSNADPGIGSAVPCS